MSVRAKSMAISVGCENNSESGGGAPRFTPGGLMVYTRAGTRGILGVTCVWCRARDSHEGRARTGGGKGQGERKRESERDRGSGAKCGGGGAVSMSGRVRHRRHTRRQYPANEWHAAASLRSPASLTIGVPHQDCRHLQLPPPLFLLRLLARSATSFTPPRSPARLCESSIARANFLVLFIPRSRSHTRCVRLGPTRDSLGCVRCRWAARRGREGESGPAS